MIIELPHTTTREISRRMVEERNRWGAVALGRVLTLIVDADSHDPEPAILAANAASRQNPCRVIVLSATSPKRGTLDAQIRVGSDAGAGEVILLRHSAKEKDQLDTLVLPLLLPDAPIVAWWPYSCPDDPSGTPIGALAGRRITSSQLCRDPEKKLAALSRNYVAGDTDMAWTRTTAWRGLIAAALDQPPYEPVQKVVLSGQTGHPSVDLIGVWMGSRLNCPVEIIYDQYAPGLTEVRIERESGPIIFSRPDGRVAELIRPDSPVQTVPLPIRGLDECVAEELRRLGPDTVYGEVLAAYGDRARAFEEAEKQDAEEQK